MRSLLMASIVAVSCGIAFGQEAVPLAVPPHAVVPQACPTPDQAEHLLAAAKHLEAAGQHDMAAQVRLQAAPETRYATKALPANKAKTQPPRPTDGDTRQVMLHLRMVEVSVDKLSRLGLDFESQMGNKVAERGLAFGSLDKKQADKVLAALRQDRLASIFAEPTLVTLNGRRANFCAGDEIPEIVKHSDGTQSIGGKPAIEIDFCPTILSDGTVQIDLQAELREVDKRQTVEVKGVALPGVSLHAIKTRTVTRSGQTVLIRGLKYSRIPTSPADKQADAPEAGKGPAAKLPDRTELLVLITPEIISPMSVSTALAK